MSTTIFGTYVNGPFLTRNVTKVLSVKLKQFSLDASVACKFSVILSASYFSLLGAHLEKFLALVFAGMINMRD